jgi:hypothetical protein
MTLTERILRDKLKIAVKKGLEYAIKEIGQSIDEKGISNTGNMKRSMRAEILEYGPIIQGVLWIAAYAKFHDQGVAPANIPYTVGGPRRGGKSKYIEGLVTYLLFKGESPKNALSGAFAIAASQKRYGSPLNYYRRFNRGSHFITDRLEKIKVKANELIKAESNDALKIAVRDYIRRELKPVQDIAILKV